LFNFKDPFIAQWFCQNKFDAAKSLEWVLQKAE
jgi:hypothetical protein